MSVKKIKDLISGDVAKICDNQYDCEHCPLQHILIKNCYFQIPGMNEAIIDLQNFLNKEVEVED